MGLSNSPSVVARLKGFNSEHSLRRKPTPGKNVKYGWWKPAAAIHRERLKEVLSAREHRRLFGLSSRIAQI